MSSRQFQVRGSAVIDKVKISASARNALQNISLKVDDRALQNSLIGVSKQIKSIANNFNKLGGTSGGGRIATQFTQLTKSIQSGNKELKEQETLFVQVLRKAAAFRAAAIVINNFVSAIEGSIGGLIAYDKALRNINKIAKLNDKELNNLGTTIIGLAAEYNQTAEAALSAFRVISQLGYSDLNQQLDIYKKALLIARTSTLDLAGSIDLLVSISNQAGISIDDAAMKIAELSAIEDASAIDIKDLADIYSRAGTSISQSFRNPTEALSLFAAVAERTRAGGAVIGTFAKTITARLGGANATVIKTFKDLGIEVNDLSGRLKDPIQLMLELKSALKGFSDEDIGSVLGKIGGIRQVELFRASLDSLGDGLTKNGRAFQISKAATNSYSSQIIKAEEDAKTFDAQIRKVTNTFLEFLSTLKDTTAPILADTISIFSTLVNVIKSGTEAFKSFGLVGSAALAGFIVNSISEGRVGKMLNGPGKLQGSLGSINRGNGNLPNAGFTREDRRFQMQPYGPQPYNGPGFQDRFVQTAGRGRNGSLEVLPRRNVDTSTISKQSIRDVLNNIVKGPVLPQGPSTQFGGKFRQPASANPVSFAKRAQNFNSKFDKRIDSLVSNPLTRSIAGKLIPAIDKASEKFPAFSRNALVAGFAFNFVGGEIESFGKKLEEGGHGIGTLVKSVGAAASTFGALLPFGVEIAAAGAVITTSFSVLKDGVGLLTQDAKSAAGALEILTRLGDKASNDSLARQVNVDEFLKSNQRNIFGGKSFSKDEESTIDKVATVLSETLLSARDNTQNFATEAERQAAAAQQIASELGNLDQKLIAGLLPILGGENKNGLFRQGLIENEQFLGQLPKVLADNIRAGFAELSATEKINPQNLFKVLASAATKSGTLSNDERVLNLRKGALSEEDLTREKELRKIRTELLKSTINLTDTEQQLSAARSGLNELEQLDRQRETLKQLSALRLKTLEDEYNALKEIDSSRVESRRTALQQEQVTISKKLGDLKGNAPASASAELKSRLRDIAEQLNTAFDVKPSEDTLKAKSALEEERNNIAAEALKLEIKYVEEERKLLQARLESQQSFASSIEETRIAQRKYALTGRDLTQVEQVKEETAIQVRSAQIKLDNAKAELALVSELRQKALGLDLKNVNAKIGTFAGKRGEADAIKNAKQNISIGKGTADDKLLLQLVEDRKKLEKQLANSTLRDTQQIKDLRLKASQEELNYLKVSIDAARQRLEAAKAENKERIEGAAGLIAKSKEFSDTITNAFEAQKSFTDAIRNKLDEAAKNIKDKRGALSSAFDGLKSAREGLYSALRTAQEGFSEYTLAVKKADIESQKILGSFYGFRDQAAALKGAFDSAIESARMLGASEQQLTKLRAESAREQLSLFTELLSEQRSKADKFFTSSGDDRLGFVQGLSAIQNIVQQFAGNIENFRNLNEGQLNSFGRELISLPQDLREKISSALDQLPNGVGIGGFTADQIKEIIQGGSLGKSGAVGITSLSDDIKTVAQLTRDAVALDTSNLAANQEQVNQARAAVGNAKEQVLIARMALVQAQKDAVETQKAIRAVSATVDTQISSFKDSLRADVQRIMANITDPQKRAEALAAAAQGAQQKIAEATRTGASQVGAVQIGGGVGVGQSNFGSPNSAAGNELLNTVLPALSKSLTELNKSFDKNATSNTAIATSLGQAADQLKDVGEKMLKSSLKNEEAIKAEISINSEQIIKVTGATELAEEIAARLKAEGFVNEKDLDTLEATIKKIVRVLIDKDVIRTGEVK